MNCAGVELEKGKQGGMLSSAIEEERLLAPNGGGGDGALAVHGKKGGGKKGSCFSGRTTLTEERPPLPKNRGLKKTRTVSK